MTPRKYPGQAVVIGGSLAGLFAARVLSDRFESVVVLERDELENTGDGRRGVPQGRHAHALLHAGRQRISDWFPGIDQELIDGGAAVASAGTDMYWFQAGGRRSHYDWQTVSPICSRPFLEEAVRARVEKTENVELRTGVHAEGLGASPDKSHVTGVTLDDGTTVDAALVLDCTGRSGRTLPWIEALGYASPDVTEVGIDMRYTTRVYAKNPQMERDWEIALVLANPPKARLAAAFPLEGERWMVTLCGYHGDQAPQDDEGFLAFPRELPTPIIGDLIEQCEPLTDYRTHRLASNQRRSVEKMRRAPAGWAMLGDSICSFNPIYGQGMSSAALQAESLGAVLDAHSTVDADLTAAIHKGAAKAVSNAWRVSTGGDFALPQTTGKRPPGTKFLNWYVARAARASHSQPAVAKAISLVGHLVNPPQSMMSPAIAWRVLRHGGAR